MSIALFCLWIILNGRISAQVVVFGVLITAAVMLFMNRAVHYTVENEKRLLWNTPLFLLYILVLIVEIIKASLSVMIMSLNPKAKPDPVMVEFSSGLEGRTVNELLANSITLTPGTYTVFQEEDRFAVHCLRREYAGDLENSVFIRILRKMKR